MLGICDTRRHGKHDLTLLILEADYKSQPTTCSNMVLTLNESDYRIYHFRLM